MDRWIIGFSLAWMSLGTLLIGVTGCANFAGNLPSFTFGGDANKDRLLGAGVNKHGMQFTVPVISINVPWPNIKATSKRAVPAGMLILMDDTGSPVRYDDNDTQPAPPEAEFALYFHESQTNLLAAERTPFTGPIHLTLTNNGASARMLEAFVKDGRLDGAAKTWYVTGEQKMDLIYEAGEITGYKQWELNGTLLAEFPVKKDVVDPLPAKVLPLLSNLRIVAGKFHLENNATPFTGQAVKKFSDGKYERLETFAGGLREGNTTWWHANRQIAYRAFFSQGNEEGIMEAFRPDGTREYTYEIDMGLPISMVTYTLAGAESGRVDENNPDGSLIYYHANGNKKLEQTYSGGLLGTNTEKWFDEQGNPLVIPEDNGTTPPPVPPPGQP